MLEENQKDILDRNYLLNKRSDARKKNRFLRHSHLNLMLGCLLGFLIVVGIYFFSDFSKIYRIVVEGNHYLSDEDIIELSKIDEDTRYLSLLSNQYAKRIEKSPYVKNCSIELLDNRLVRINVVENQILGYYLHDGKSYLLMENDDSIEIDISNVYLSAYVPLIEGYSMEELANVKYYLLKLDDKLINEISEIHRYPFSYDANMMEVIMRDGNYVFVSPIGAKMLENYYDIISSLGLSNDEICIYLDEVSNSGYVSACPWEAVFTDDANSDSIAE